MATPKQKKAPAKKASPAKTKALAVPADAAPPVTGSQADYDALLPAAQALSASAVVPFRANAQLAYHNVQIGVTSLLAKKAEAAALPGTDVAALSALPSQCLAVAFAVDQATQAEAGPSATLATQLAQGSLLRRKLFAAADALVEAGLFPAQPVAALHAGRGKIDTANDLVGLAALFQKNAATIKGKTAIVAADVTNAATIGSSLLTVLKPTRAKKTRTGNAAQAADIRNRMWTIVLQGYDALWRAGAYLYGPDALDAKVPALQASAATTSKRKKANAAKKAAKAAATAKP
jgi:hypothetical protein